MGVRLFCFITVNVADIVVPSATIVVVLVFYGDVVVVVVDKDDDYDVDGVLFLCFICYPFRCIKIASVLALTLAL